MNVCVYSDKGPLIWSRDSEGGVTADSYLHDGMQQKIIAALIEALAEARGQLGRVPLKIVNVVADVGTTAAKVDCCVPIPITRNNNAGR